MVESANYFIYFVCLEIGDTKLEGFLKTRRSGSNSRPLDLDPLLAKEIFELDTEKKITIEVCLMKFALFSLVHTVSYLIYMQSVH